jgi:hypothetical protein
MRFPFVLALAALTLGAQAPQGPNLAAQREAMKKLGFLAGKWSGPGTVIRAGEPFKLTQSEEVQFKLDGLVMLVEGTGRGPGGEVVFRAMATISYDDASSTYRFRAYSEGRYLDTDLKVLPKGFVWGFTSGPVKVVNTMDLTDKGEWHEITEVTAGNAPPRKTLDMTLKHLP